MATQDRLNTLAANDDHGDSLSLDLLSIHRRFRGVPLAEHESRLASLDASLWRRCMRHSQPRPASWQHLNSIRESVTLRFSQVPRKLSRYCDTVCRFIHAYWGVVLRSLWRSIVIFVRIFRIMVFIVTTISYFTDIIRYSLHYCNFVTYSESFVGDLVSYVFQNSASLLERHRQIIARDGQILYFLADDRDDLTFFDEILPVRLAGTAIYNIVASLLVTNCTTENLDKCGITRGSLVFKFSDALRNNLPVLADPGRAWALVTASVTVYLLYSATGLLVSIAITAFLILNLIVRFLRFAPFVKRMASLISASVGLVA